MASANALLQGVTSAEHPVLLIKYGPPASGKGTCLPAFYEAAKPLGFDPANFLDANVDAVVEALDVKGRVKANPDAYWEFRGEANTIIETALTEGFERRLHIVLETTGRVVDPQWLQDDLIGPARENGYKIIVVYPLVPVPTLIERSAARAELIGRNPEPKLIEAAAKAAAANIYHFVGTADKIVIYDNRGLPACKYAVVACEKNQCRADTAWAVDRAIQELFDVSLTVTGGGRQSGYFARAAVLLAVLVVLVLLIVALVRFVLPAGVPRTAPAAKPWR